MPQAVTATSTLDVAPQYHLDMLDFILAIMYAKDRDNQMATYHRNIWEGTVDRIKRNNKKSKHSDEFAVVGDYSYDYGYTHGSYRIL